MTPDQVAAESFAFWSPKVRLPLHAFALLGNEDRETSFNPKAVGDHGQAFGPFQHHPARCDAIQKGCGIDIRMAGHVEQLQAAFFEMTEGEYKRVWPLFQATSTLWSACQVLVREYERSANQARDVRRQVLLAEKWALRFQHAPML